MKQLIQTVTIALTMFFQMHCTQNSVAGGAGEETTNGMVYGVVRDASGSPVAGASVTLAPEYYNPMHDTQMVLNDTTDSAGCFTFTRIDSGKYTVSSVDAGHSLYALTPSVIIGLDTTELPSMELQPPGAVNVQLPATATDFGGYLYIPGTAIYTDIKKGDTWAVLDTVPAACLTSIAFAATSTDTSKVIRYSVTVKSAETAIVNNPDWLYSRSVNLNTTTSGAAVAETVTHFPVLLRLSEETFPFGLADKNGNDIRFTKSDNTALPYEIEQWDPVQKHAVIWVQLDTVYGNSATQSFLMYWGNSAALPQSSSATVFDTADGFAGVWHLGDEVEDSLHDATANRLHGGSPNTAQPLRADGVTGFCRRFNGIDDYITMPNTATGALDFPEAGDYTLYAWVSPDSLDNNSHSIIAKGHAQYFLWLTYASVNAPVWEFVEFGQSSNWQVVAPVQADDAWILLVGVRQGGRHMLFCNGALVDSSSNEWPQAYPRNTAEDLTIGRFLNGVPFNTNDGSSFFRGSIDEVRICGVAHSPAWIHLCYMNQRPDNRLIEFE